MEHARATDPRFVTADGHTIEDGSIFWDNNLDRVKVVFDEHINSEYWDGWFNTEYVEDTDWYRDFGEHPPRTRKGQRGHIMNGERLAKRHPHDRKEA